MSTRDKVLETLLTRERCSITELAKAVDINPISVRHHISRLEAEGLVNSEENRKGVGRPYRLYFLTEKGRERFPSRYIQLTLRLLEQLKETMPKPIVRNLFDQIAKDIASDYEREMHGLSLEQRLDLVKALLSREGFTMEWKRQGNKYEIREVSCPYFHIGQNHPEVCLVDQTLISILLDIPVKKIQCILQGDSHCTYTITTTNDQESTES